MILVTHYVLMGMKQEQRARVVQMHSDVYPLSNYGYRWGGCAARGYTDQPSHIANSIYLEQNIKLYIIYDRWSKEDQMVIRVQNFNLECAGELEVTGVASVVEKSLDYTWDRQQVIQRQSKLQWIANSHNYVQSHQLNNNTLNILL